MDVDKLFPCILDHDAPTSLSAHSGQQRQALTGQWRSYRSKAFNLDAGLNPLTAAAAPLLSIATKLAETNLPPDSKRLLTDLTHEIKAFEQLAQARGYRSNIILAARYALCALVDEKILSTVWGKSFHWDEHSLLSTFQNETWGGERFFTLLARANEDPLLHLDLLELFYLCLNLGFEGQYRHDPEGQAVLTALMDELYESLRHQRGDYSQCLLVGPTNTDLKRAKRHPHIVPLWVGTATLAALTGLVTLVTRSGHLGPFLNSVKQIMTRGI